MPAIDGLLLCRFAAAAAGVFFAYLAAVGIIIVYPSLRLGVVLSLSFLMICCCWSLTPCAIDCALIILRSTRIYLPLFFWFLGGVISDVYCTVVHFGRDFFPCPIRTQLLRLW